MKDYKFDLEVEGKKYSLAFTLNVMETIQDEYGSLQKWGELTDGKSGEPNVKALVFSFTEMMNEAVEIENEETSSEKPLFTKKQVARILTKIGLENAVKQLNTAIIESTKTDEKNA